MKFGTPLAIIVYYTVLRSIECCKSCETDMYPNTILKIMKIIKIRIEGKWNNFTTYDHDKIWYTTCYHSPLHGTLQFGVLLKLWDRHGP